MILNQLNQLEFVSDIPVYMLELLQSDYSLKPIIIDILPQIHQSFKDPHICVPIIREFLLDQDRSTLYNFIIARQDLHPPLYDELISSSFYQHRLALGEIIKAKGVSGTDLKYIERLLYDDMEIVSKLAITLVDKRFEQDRLLQIIERFNNASYFLQGSCPLLLTHLDNEDQLGTYVKQFIACETWMVRYNLCKVLNYIKIDEVLLTYCCERFVIDVVEEIRVLFCETVCCIQNERLQLYFIKKMSIDTSNSVRLAFIEELRTLMGNNEDPIKHKFLLNIMKNMLKVGEIGAKLLLCETISKNMLRTFKSLQNPEILKVASELDSTTDLNTQFNTISDFHFLFDHFAVFSENNKWRSRVRLLNMIIYFCTDDIDYFSLHLKKFFFCLLKDKVEEIRHSAAIAFVGLVNKFGSSFLVKNIDDIRELVVSKKYPIRIISVDILGKVLYLKNIESAVYDEYVYPLLQVLRNDSVENLRQYYEEVVGPANVVQK